MSYIPCIKFFTNKESIIVIALLILFCLVTKYIVTELPLRLQQYWHKQAEVIILQNKNYSTSSKCNFISAIILGIISLCISIFRYDINQIFFLLLPLLISLIWLAIIDWYYFLLPDVIIFPVLWLGLLINSQNIFVHFPAAVIGVIVAYSSLMIINTLFTIIMNKSGLGYGDCKLFAMLGAWFGWQPLASILLLACCIGLIYAVLSWCYQSRSVRIIPFGSCLAISAWLLLLFPHLNNVLYFL